jgi:CDGSH-type Zn-finger protein
MFPEQDLGYKEKRGRTKSEVKNERESDSSFVICGCGGSLEKAER